MFRFANIEGFQQATADSDIVFLVGHYGCWEYMKIMGIIDPTHKLLSVYHPLSSNALDDFFKRIRHLENTELVPREDCLLYFMRNRGKGQKLALGLIADQNRFWYANAHWITFLNQDTIFANGGELIARRLSLPVWTGYMRRLRRGEYEFVATQIYDGHEAVAENEITERYARHLEQAICVCPELWLWSHRRWKHKRNMNL